VSHGLEAGAVIASDAPIDPTSAVDGTYILYGSIGRRLSAVFFASMAYAISRTRLLPGWTVKGSLPCARGHQSRVRSVLDLR